MYQCDRQRRHIEVADGRCPTRREEGGEGGAEGDGGREGEREHQEEERAYYAFAEELSIGTIEHIEEIDKHIKEHANNWSFDRIAKVDLAILRLAIYELLFRTDIPPIVSINEAIDLSKVFSTPDSKRFVNGILDKMKGKITRPLRKAVD